MYKFDGSDNSLIRRRINENLLTVKDESQDVKHLLKLSLQTADPLKYDRGSRSITDAYGDLDFYSLYTSRKDLLRTAIILATSRNTVARDNLMDVVSLRLGKIKSKDYKYMANLIYLKDPIIVEKVNTYLSRKLSGFYEMYRKYYAEFYGF